MLSVLHFLVNLLEPFLSQMEMPLKISFGIDDILAATLVDGDLKI